MKKRITFTKQQRMFLLFCGISAFFWLLKNLAKEHHGRIAYRIEYINLPERRRFQNTPASKIYLDIKGTGFELLRQYFSNKKIVLDLSKLIERSRYQYQLLLNGQKASLQRQLGNNIVLQGFEKEVLSFGLDFDKVKKIPIKTNISLTYRSGYDRAEAIEVSPDSITIKGAESQVDTIQFINTKTLELSDISENIQKELPLVLPKNIQSDIQKIKILFKVEKFTEGHFDVPFEIINKPEDIKIITKPQKITLYYKVGISRFSQVQPSSFQIICDYTKSKENNYDFMILQIKKQPKFVKDVKISPEKVSFLIQNK